MRGTIVFGRPFGGRRGADGQALALVAAVLRGAVLGEVAPQAAGRRPIQFHRLPAAGAVAQRFAVERLVRFRFGAGGWLRFGRGGRVFKVLRAPWRHRRIGRRLPRALGKRRSDGDWRERRSDRQDEQIPCRGSVPPKMLQPSLAARVSHRTFRAQDGGARKGASAYLWRSFGLQS